MFTEEVLPRSIEWDWNGATGDLGSGGSGGALRGDVLPADQPSALQPWRPPEGGPGNFDSGPRSLERQGIPRIVYFLGFPLVMGAAGTLFFVGAATVVWAAAGAATLTATIYVTKPIFGALSGAVAGFFRDLGKREESISQAVMDRQGGSAPASGGGWFGGLWGGGGSYQQTDNRRWTDNRHWGHRPSTQGPLIGIGNKSTSIGEVTIHVHSPSFKDRLLASCTTIGVIGVALLGLAVFVKCENDRLAEQEFLRERQRQAAQLVAVREADLALPSSRLNSREDIVSQRLTGRVTCWQPGKIGQPSIDQKWRRVGVVLPNGRICVW